MNADETNARIAILLEAAQAYNRGSLELYQYDEIRRVAGLNPVPTAQARAA